MSTLPSTPREPARDPLRAQRVEMAIAMRIRGCQWAEIAEACGLKGGKGSAYHMVNDALRATLREATDELRTLEVLRLDALLEAIWPEAVRQLTEDAGDEQERQSRHTPSGKKKSAKDGPNLWAVDRCLAIMERRAKLLGLDIPTNQAPLGAQVIIRSYGAAGEAV